MKFLFYFPTYIFSKSFWTNKIKMKFLIVATVISCLLQSVYGAEYAKCYFPEDGSVKGHIYFMEDDDATYGHILLTVQGKHRRFPVHIHDGVCNPEAFTPFDDPNTPGLQSYLGDFLATPKGLVLISNFETSDISFNKNNSIVGRSVVVQMSGKEDQACCEVVPSNEEEYYSHSDEHDHHDDEDRDDHHDDEDHHDDDEDSDDHDDHDEEDHDDDYNHITDGEEDHGERTEVEDEEEKEDFNQMNAELLYIMLLKKFLGQL